jgi:muramoyltetrapeptide carboxypeptidase LdcA involved in peptidoglycan recycling
LTGVRRRFRRLRRQASSFSLEEILRDRFGTLPVPLISGLSFGHIEQKSFVLAIGAVMGRFDGRNRPQAPYFQEVAQKIVADS